MVLSPPYSSDAVSHFRQSLIPSVPLSFPFRSPLLFAFARPCAASPPLFFLPPPPRGRRSTVLSVEASVPPVSLSVESSFSSLSSWSLAARCRCRSLPCDSAKSAELSRATRDEGVRDHADRPFESPLRGPIRSSLADLRIRPRAHQPPRGRPTAPFRSTAKGSNPSLGGLGRPWSRTSKVSARRR